MSKKTEHMNDEPTLNEWRRLYEIAIAFRDLAPWKWMFEDQMFAVVDPEDGEVGYCCVMGAGGEFHALGVYRGKEGLLSYERIHRQSVDLPGYGDPDVGLDQKALIASFEGSGDVSQRDRNVFQSLGLRFRGKQSWPVLRSYEPGCLPWYLTAKECRFLTEALEQAVSVVQRVKENPKLLDEQPGCILTRVYINDGQASEWVDQWREWPDLEDEIYSDYLGPVIHVDEMRLKRAIKEGEPSGSWEVDISYAPFTIAEGERPYFPRLMLCVHHGSGMILAFHPGDRDAAPSEFIEQFMAAMEQHNMYPEQIVVSRENVGQLLLPIAQAIGADLLVADFLPGVDEALEGMRKFMG